MKLEAIDKQMSIEHNGVVYKNNDGVIDVPDSVGEKFLEASRNGKREFVGKYTKFVGFSHISREEWNRIFGKK
jgi:hypothetical protein